MDRMIGKSVTAHQMVTLLFLPWLGLNQGASGNGLRVFAIATILQNPACFCSNSL